MGWYVTSLLYLGGQNISRGPQSEHALERITANGRNAGNLAIWQLDILADTTTALLAFVVCGGIIFEVMRMFF